MAAKLSICADELKRQLFFQIRMWDADDVIDALLTNYEGLPDEIKADIPLRRIWTLVAEEE
jgi:restriction system protein